MLPKACIVEAVEGQLPVEAVRTYRHYGVLLVRNLLSGHTLQTLTTLCNDTARGRGGDVFPGLDPEHRHGSTRGYSAEVHPKATTAAKESGTEAPAGLRFGDGPFPPEAVKQAAAMDRDRVFDSQTRKVHIKMRNQRTVDRAFRKLTQLRNQHMERRRLPKYVTEDEEVAGKASDARITEIQGKYQYEDLKRGFEAYRDSGELESELRRDHFVNEAARFMQNWPRTWCALGQTNPKLRSLALCAGGAAGRVIGDVAGQLSGEVLLRVYMDSAMQDDGLLNSASLGVNAVSTNFVHLNALGVQMGLTQPETMASGAQGRISQLVMPGSHHVVCKISSDGRQLDRFRGGGVFDIGSVVRGVPELSHLPLAVIPPLPPGAALFLNNYVVTGVMPTMAGAAASGPLSAAMSAFTHASIYAVSVMPDQCVFDGERNSWMSRDTHGPLHGLKKGDLLTDEKLFPVLHRALDIE